MKILLAIMAFLSVTAAFGQAYETKLIIAKADSILYSEAGKNLFQFFTYDPESYYTYTIKNKIKIRLLNPKSKTKGNFTGTDVRFNFVNPEYPWIRGFTAIKLDSLLHQRDSVFLDFIPEFLRKGAENNFISKEQAIQIAKDSVLHERIKRIDGKLEFSPFKIKGYCWIISNYLIEHTDGVGNQYGKVDVVLIDPLTGKILRYWYNGDYGAFYQTEYY